jgi:Holliday junction DNA helicase RuvA
VIAKLKGILDSTAEDHAIIDVHGVGYLVHCSSRTLARLPSVGEAVSLEIETRVREDAIQLFGFLQAEECRWFRLLQDVQGVGAKLALSILSAFAPAELSQSIARGDKATLARAPGVGPKLAARLAMELKDKASAFAEAAADNSAPKPDAEADLSALASAKAEASSALINLGYRSADAERAVTAALAKAQADAPVATVIRLALRELAR